MVYFTEKFPPQVSYTLNSNLSRPQLSFHYGKDEMAYLEVGVEYDKTGKRDTFIIHGIGRTSLSRKWFPREHLGTEILNAALWELYSNWNYIPSKINGRLSNVDAKNGNWKKSIPFYFHFPNYLHEKLPYYLSFHLYSDRERTNEIVIPQDDVYNFASEIALEKKNKPGWLYFQYEVVPKGCK